ncbi:Nn.00g014320.m01.CDS01 [Neocucurbitaria sp. VM-36]
MSAIDTTALPPQINPPTAAAPLTSESKPANDEGILAKGKKILGLGKKQEGAGDQQYFEKAGATSRTMSPTSAPTLLPSPPLTMSPGDRRASPRGSPRMLPVGASPNRRINRSSSPGLHSPSSSSIFERNVQEPEPSADVPAHIKTEDYIPPALDASSLAITDDHLNPDEVEIVMHSAHQPASAAVAGGMTDSVYSPSLRQEDSTASGPADMTESTPGYGSLDMSDPRRLSFISFADVVQAEHVEHDRQEMLGSSEALQFTSLSATANRSPSPVRSPASSHGLSASPPLSGAASPKGADHGRTRSPGSPTSPTAAGTQSPPLGGELPLQIETMRQALRKTHSGDLSGFRSQPLSAVSLEDNAADKPPFK